jgi:hypothetical protein
MAVQQGHKMTENKEEKQEWLLYRISRTVENKCNYTKQ